MGETDAIRFDGGSWRDPAGRVFERGSRIFRTVTSAAAEDYRAVEATGLFEDLVNRGWLVATDSAPRDLWENSDSDVALVLEHARLALISYPYEWSFGLLKAAALFHLDLHLQALEHRVTLSDASAYNVQFQGHRPTFIDVLSFRPYRDGEYWRAHRQFCEQFLNPLLLRAKLGIAHNAWYRGQLEGIAVEDLADLLGLRHKFSWTVWVHVVLQARLQRSAMAGGGAADRLKSAKSLPLASFRAMLIGLRQFIDKLQVRQHGKTVWGDYAVSHGYTDEEERAKRAFVAAFVAREKPGILWDLGCNAGDYAALALAEGAGSVVGFDYDKLALERAHARAVAEDLAFLPLYLDACNPSPAQGWRSCERKSLQERTNADAIIALAFVHHLAIARNVPLDQAVDWLLSLAPRGVIEFVPKNDPTVQQMLALREDIFGGYDEAQFAAALQARARILRKAPVSASGRMLFWYERA